MVRKCDAIHPVFMCVFLAIPAELICKFPVFDIVKRSKQVFITARIRRMGKVLVSQVSVLPNGGGVYPSARFFPRSLVPGPFWGIPQSQVLSLVSHPRSFLGGTLVSAGGSQSWLGVPQD